jgi:hypothetical protein
MKIVAQLLIASTSLAIGLLSASSAQALEFTEPGTDVGELLRDAADAGTADLIRGSIDTRKVNEGTGIKDIFDVDLFKITIAMAGRSTFVADPVVVEGVAPLDINLFLFNSKGNPLASIEPVTSDSMTIEYETLPGDYYLGIGSDDSDALGFDPNGNLRRIAGNDSGVEFADGILAGWARGAEKTGGYTIKISTVPTAVPTPALLPGLVGLGLKLMRRRQRENATSNLAIEV